MLWLGAQLRLDLAIYLEISQSAYLAVNLNTGLMYTTVLEAVLIKLTWAMIYTVYYMYVFLLHVTSECSAFKTQQMQENKVHVSIIIIYTWILGKV